MNTVDDVVDLPTPKMLMLAIFLSCIVSTICSELTNNTNSSEFSKPYESEEGRLIWWLLADYNRRIRPVVNSSFPVTVGIYFTLHKIEDVKLVDQTLNVQGSLIIRWMDQGLIWDPSHYGGMTHLALSSRDLWLPEIAFLNSVDDIILKYDKDERVLVFHDGGCSIQPVRHFRSSCKVTVTKFPFDLQKCLSKVIPCIYDVILGGLTYSTISYASDKQRLVALKDTNGDMVGFGDYTESDRWNLLSTSGYDSLKTYADGEFRSVTYQFVVARHPAFYLNHLVVPAIVLAVLVPLIFVIPPSEGEKASVCVTVLLAYSIYLVMITEQIPPVAKETPLVSIYLLGQLLLTAVAQLLTVCILRIYHHTLSNPPSDFLYIITARVWYGKRDGVRHSDTISLTDFQNDSSIRDGTDSHMARQIAQDWHRVALGIDNWSLVAMTILTICWSVVCLTMASA